jgi:hypothetical protein
LIRSRRLRAPLALLLGLSLVAAACGNDDDGAAPAPDNGDAPATADCIEAYDGPTDAPADDGNGDDANGDDEGNGDDTTTTRPTPPTPRATTRATATTRARPRS